MATPLCWNPFDAVNFRMNSRPVTARAYLLKSVINGTKYFDALVLIIFLPAARSAMPIRRDGGYEVYCQF
jgi:hypothetical protein